GETRRGVGPSAVGKTKAREAAARWSARLGVPIIDHQTLARWKQETDRRTLYCLDVRLPEEHVAGHPAGFVSAPGGQLVQATDEWVGVRGARLVLSDDDGVRARMTASWLKQMGWDASIVGPDVVAPSEQSIPAPRRPALPDIGAAAIGVEELASNPVRWITVDLS